MTYLGIDTAARLSAAAAKTLKDNGISFVGRYLVPAGMGKDLTASEIAGLRDAGLAILLCWEIGAGDIKGGAERGAKDGSRAKALAVQFGVPAGTTIFFACDYCPVQGDYPAIEAYMRAAQAACKPYIAGLYGCAKIVDYIAQQGASEKFWQCVAWSEGKISAHTNVYQYQWSGGPESKAMQAKIGIPVDMNRTEDMKAAGLWMPTYTQYDDGEGGTIIEPSKPSAQPAPWYKEHMDWAAENGIMNDGRPNDNITRAESATILHREDERVETRIAKLEARIEMLESALDKKVIEAVKRRLPDDDSFGGLLG